MRIVGGELGGRRFAGPRGGTTRPTSERVREGIASALEARGAIRGATVLDLFAGTGALAFEALSRGADTAVLAERDRRNLAAIRASAAALGLADRVRTVAVDLLGAPDLVVRRLPAPESGRATYSLVFADPPYEAIASLGPLLDAACAARLVDETTLFVIESAARKPFAPSAGSLPLASVARYRYGDTVVELLQATYPEPP